MDRITEYLVLSETALPYWVLIDKEIRKMCWYYNSDFATMTA